MEKVCNDKKLPESRNSELQQPSDSPNHGTCRVRQAAFNWSAVVCTYTGPQIHSGSLSPEMGHLELHHEAPEGSGDPKPSVSCRPSPRDSVNMADVRCFLGGSP